jgi:hypothetical protein
MIKEKKELFTSLWDIIDYSISYSLVLDSELKIRLINFTLAKELTNEDRDKLIGKSWLDFVVENDRPLLEYARKSLFGEVKFYFEECYNIICKDSSLKKVKWIMSYINSDFNSIISIGIPFIIEKRNNIRELSRTHYENIVLADRIKIKVAKELALKNSERIISRRIASVYGNTILKEQL